MTQIKLDVIETQDPNGGLAVIRIRGLTSMPPDPTFRIDPIDEALTQDGEVDWPTGPRRPAAVRATDGAFELILGPDVLDSPLLLPGTPVVISVTDTAATAELVWPSITARRVNGRRPVIVTDALRNAERQAIETRRTEAAANLAAATARVEAEARSAAPPDRRQRSSTGRTGSMRASSEAAKSLPATPHPTLHNAGLDGPHGPDGRVLSGFTLPLQGTPAASTLIRQDGTLGLQGLSTTGTALAPLPAPAAQPPSRLGRQLAAFAGGMAAAALLVLGLVQFRVLQLQPADHLAAGSPDIALTAARNAGSLRTVLATGGVSPRGRTAAGVDGGSALRLADAHLYGASDAPRDQGEASFWLRHALSQAIDHESMKWALTQLGSIYAAPEGLEPDFAKARLLWEISGALGDPVALCFNASLYEHGLGMPKHRDLARALYERARNAGGCRGVDDAVARTK